MTTSSLPSPLRSPVAALKVSSPPEYEVIAVVKICVADAGELGVIGRGLRFLCTDANIFSAGVKGRGDFGMGSERVKGPAGFALTRENFCAAAPVGQSAQARTAASTTSKEVTRFESMNSSPLRSIDQLGHPMEAETLNWRVGEMFSLRWRECNVD